MKAGCIRVLGIETVQDPVVLLIPCAVKLMLFADESCFKFSMAEFAVTDIVPELDETV